LTHQLEKETIAYKNVIWNKLVPIIKVSIFVWWLLNNRLPSKENLVCRGILTGDLAQCIGACGKEEYINHLIF
jgi:hypothetical protein